MEVRTEMLAKRGIQFLGVGISGGEYGARHGPSIMPGGPPDAYERVRPIFEAIAANVNGEPCVTYLGPGSAGHYVKMVHNGIEYGVMQLIAETYDLMKRGLGATDDKLRDVYDLWHRGELNSYLMEITARIFGQMDKKTGKRLIDVILDAAKQTGTGMWTSQDAMDEQVPLPTIDVAVAMRNLSALEKERAEGSRALPRPIRHFEGDSHAFIEQLRKRPLRGNDHHLCAGHGAAGRGFGQARVSSGSRGNRPHLAGRLHYSRRVAGGYPRCVPRQAGPGESASRSRTCPRR
jgi:6-phosphogluconate dehydrogenase